MKTGLAAVVVVAVLSAAAIGQRAAARIYTLDLTLPDVVETSPVIGTGGGIGFSGQRISVLPLELTLSLLDRATYIVGSAVTYEVSVRNAGKVPFVIPWSVDRAALEQRLRAAISLQITDQEGNERHFGTVILEGSPSMPESLQALLPGDTASIRVRRQVSADADAAIWMASAGAVPVRASFAFRADPRVPWAPLLSVNAIPTSFRLARVP